MVIGREPHGSQKGRGAINRVTGRDMVSLGVKPPTREEHLRKRKVTNRNVTHRDW